MASPLRVVFLGSDEIARLALDWLAGEGRTVAAVVGVFTQPDRPAGRGQRVQPNAIKAWALERGLPVWQPEKLQGGEQAALADLRPDLALVMAYGHILSDAFIAIPRLGTVNLHASLLPKYRGASPIQAAIAGGEAESGVSLMRIVRALDAGPVAAVERVPIERRDTAVELTAKLAAACPRLLARTLPDLAAGHLDFVEQDGSRASFCRKLKKLDGVLDFTAPAAVLAARINALHPWPGCVVDIAGQPIRLGLAEAVEIAPPSAPGRILDGEPAALSVATGRGTLRLLRLQRPGGRLLPAAEFLRGFAIPPGLVLPSQAMPALARGPA